MVATFAAFLCMITMMPLTAEAETVINETSSEQLSKTSTVYVGEVVVNGVTVIKYLYSGDVTIASDLVNNVLDCLNGMADGDYATLLNGNEFDYTLQPAAEGFAFCSNSELVAAMDGNWNSARYVGTQYYPHKTVTSEVNSNLYDLNNGFKTVLDTKNADRLATIDNPINEEKCIVSHIGSSTNDNVSYTFEGGAPVKHVDRTVTYDCEATIVMYTKVELQPLSLADNTDNSDAISTNDGDVYDITLGRTLQAGGWNTFCAPFEISSSQITSVFGDGTKVRELGSSDFNSTTKELTLNFTNASSIDAGKPYLVYLGSGSNVVNPTFEDVTIAKGTTPTTTTYADFVPVMNPTPLTGGNKTVLFVTGGDKLTYPLADGNINGFRAYFKLKEGAAAEARAYTMNFDDSDEDAADAIVSPLGETEEGAGAIYNIAGQRLQKMQKGINIVNGKKTIIR